MRKVFFYFFKSSGQFVSVALNASEITFSRLTLYLMYAKWVCNIEKIREVTLVKVTQSQYCFSKFSQYGSIDKL